MKVIKDDNATLLVDPSPHTEDLLGRIVGRAVRVPPRIRPARSRKRPPSPKVLIKRRQEARKKKVLSDRKLQARRAESNICVRCGKRPPWEDNKACEFCLEYYANRRKDLKERQLEA